MKTVFTAIKPGDRVREANTNHEGMATRILDGPPYRKIGPYAMVEWDGGAYTSVSIASLTLAARAVYMTPTDIAAVESTMCSGFRGGDTSPCTNDCSCAVINAFLGVGSES